MKSLTCSMLVLFAAGILALGGNSPSAPAPAVASVETVAASCDGPICKCQSCECVNCSSIKEPLAVGPPPDTHFVSEPTKFTQPVPEPKPEVAKPKATPAPVAAGHWQMVQSCGPRGCSMQQVWVPHSQVATKPQVYQAPTNYGSCGPGGCGVRGRGLFGRRR